LRKILVTLLTVCVLSGLFLAGAMPAMAMPIAHESGMTAAPMTDCAHHDSQPKPLPQKQSGHADLSCCVNGHCPMLAQGLMPADAAQQPFPMGSLLRPVIVSLDRGIIDAPHPRPPSDFL
jgi:hypothetical protein